jgi:2-C-methyl-D-erythritol 4-phosphate cytidylyltransferase
MGADGDAPRKPFLPLGGSTLLEQACAPFHRAASVVEIVLVVHGDDLERCRGMVANHARHPSLAKVTAVVAGGAERSDSVRAGVERVGAQPAIVLVHDAARPMVRTETIERAIAVAAQQGAALVAVPVRDTLKRSADGSRAEATVDRSSLWAAQTPQAFEVDRLKQLLERARSEGLSATDESSLHERFLGPVPIVEGDPGNLKITTPADLAIAEALFAARREGRA